MAFALVFVMTFFIKIPVFSGYVHPGDGAGYAFSFLLASPYAAFFLALSQALADVMGGYAVYAPFTLIIKSAAFLPFYFMSKGHVPDNAGGNVLCLLFASLFVVTGYFLADYLVLGAYAFQGAVFNLFQCLASGVVYVTLKKALFHAGIAGAKKNAKKI